VPRDNAVIKSVNNSVRRVKGSVPWQAKMTTKLILARLPISWDVWHSMGFFRHGDMDVPTHAFAVTARHFELAEQAIALPASFTGMELGPGNSQISALCLAAFGASKVVYIDKGTLSVTTDEQWEAMRQTLVNSTSSSTRFHPETVQKPEIDFWTNGTDDLERIEPSTIDLIWSKDVLEHVYVSELPALLRAQRRALSESGVCVHSVDFADHLSGGLVNTYFPSKVWESKWFRQSGFYTNRASYEELVDMIRQAGFDIEIIDKLDFPAKKVKHRFMRRSFKVKYASVEPTRRATFILRPR
jgi:predicted SAM-dependent methyltransferase